MEPLARVRLTALMERTSGGAEIVVGLVDGPVVIDHPHLTGSRIREIPGTSGGACARASSAACLHGTLVAGILSAQRDSPAPTICPGCTLLLCPVFSETAPVNGAMPSATPEELAAAISDCVEAGARVLNLSVALSRPSSGGQQELQGALDHAMRRGVLIVAAAGNQGTVGSTVIPG